MRDAMLNRLRFRLFRLTLLPLAIGCLSPVFPSAMAKAHRDDVVHLEKVEWTWSDRSDPIDPALPNVLLLGDSITRGYFPEVARKLAGKANVYLFATSCSAGDPRFAGQLRDYFRYEPTFSAIHFNNGMHGWSYTEGEFAAALPVMVEAIRKAQPKSRLIWATITPVRRDDPSGASNARIDARNAAALKIMSHEGIAIDDQHGLMAAHGDLHLDDVHYNEEGSRLQGDQAIKDLLPGEFRDRSLR
jgi:lysophospholipase L1-like esterase